MYDAIVLKLKKISPETKFVGLSLAHVTEPEYFEYFLNPKIISQEFHWKEFLTTIILNLQLKVSNWNLINIHFRKCQCILDKVRYIENIRNDLPKTFTMINEIGVILRSSEVSGPIEENYWNLAGAMYAYYISGIGKDRNRYKQVNPNSLVTLLNFLM